MPLIPDGAVDLSGIQIPITEVRIYPTAIVTVREGGDGIGDATHHLAIVLVAQGQEVRIPYTVTALRKLQRDISAVLKDNPRSTTR